MSWVFAGQACLYQQGNAVSVPTGALPGVAVSMCALVLLIRCHDAGHAAAASQSDACAHMCALHQQQALQQVSHTRVGMLTLPEQQALLLHKSFLCTSSVRSLQAIFRTRTESSPWHFCCYLFQCKLNLMELLCCRQAASMRELSTIPCFWSRPYLP